MQGQMFDNLLHMNELNKSRSQIVYYKLLPSHTLGTCCYYISYTLEQTCRFYAFLSEKEMSFFIKKWRKIIT